MKIIGKSAKKAVLWYIKRYHPTAEVELSNVGEVTKEALIDLIVRLGFWTKDVVIMGAFITLALTPTQGLNPVNGLYAFGVWLAFEMISEVKKRIRG